MTTPIVSELPLRLEPLTRDPFIDGLAEQIEVAFLPAPAPVRHAVTPSCITARPFGGTARPTSIRIRGVRDPIGVRRLARHGKTS
jgi:hypothetical protein